MPTTAKHALRYPAGTDTADVPRDLQNLAEDLDGAIAVYAEGTLGARPAAGKAGRWYREEGGTGLLFIDDGEEWVEVALAAVGVPVGAITAFGGAVAPTGWLICDGTEKAVATYPALDALLTTIYGARTNGAGGAGSSHFRLPDLRGRVPAGVDGAAGRLAANDALGNAGGAETHVLSSGEMPAHAHSIDAVGNHAHSGPAQGFVGDTGAGPTTQAGGSHRFYNGQGMGQAGAHSHSMQNAGGGGAHNNLQPYLVITYIIKT